MAYDCEETYRRLAEYLDRELTEAEMAEVRRHLADCGVCNEEYEFESSVLRHIRRCLKDAPVPEDLISRVELALDRAEK